MKTNEQLRLEAIINRVIEARKNNDKLSEIYALDAIYAIWRQTKNQRTEKLASRAIDKYAPAQL